MAEKYTPDPAVAMFALILVVPMALWAGFVFSRLWFWFIVPLGVQPIGAWTGAGLYLMGRYLCSSQRPVDGEDDWYQRVFGYPIVLPALALGLGALYNVFQR